MYFTGILLAVVLSVAAGHFAPHEVHHHAQPYAFGYSVKDHHGEQHREESGDGGHGVKGSYGFTDDRGIHREVHYVADHGGFRAEVKTNEPGTANQDPAAVKIHSSAHPGHHGGSVLGHHGGHGHGHHGGPVHAGAYGVGAGPVGGYGYGPVGGAVGHGHGYKYGGPLHGGYVSGYDSRNTHF